LYLIEHSKIWFILFKLDQRWLLEEVFGLYESSDNRQRSRTIMRKEIENKLHTEQNYTWSGTKGSLPLLRDRIGAQPPGYLYAGIEPADCLAIIALQRH
jgi:hypothetical protein